MSDLTMDMLLATIRDAKRLMPQNTGPTRVVVSNHLPRIPYTKIVPVKAPPWFAKVLRFFGVDDFVCWGSLGQKSMPGSVFMFNGTLLCSPEQYAEMKS